MAEGIAKLEQTLEKLETALAEIRIEIREGHSLLKELRKTRKEMDAFLKAETEALDSSVDELISNIVKEGLTRYAESLDKAIENATAAVYDRFDTITNIMLGADNKSNRDHITGPLRVLYSQKNELEQTEIKAKLRRAGIEIPLVKPKDE